MKSYEVKVKDNKQRSKLGYGGNPKVIKTKGVYVDGDEIIHLDIGHRKGKEIKGGFNFELGREFNKFAIGAYPEHRMKKKKISKQDEINELKRKLKEYGSR